MIEIEMLKWVIGGAHLPEGEVNEGRLAQLLSYHRLEKRFLDRVKQERPAWCSRQFTFQVFNSYNFAKKAVQRHLAAVREIADALPPDNDSPLITIKGFSTYAVLDDPCALTYSGDIDMLYSDPKVLLATLEQLGYTGNKANHDDPNYHEVAVVDRNGIVIELHRFFRVWSYPEGVREANLVRNANPARWVQSFGPIQERRIEYQDILQHSINGQALGMEQSVVPDANMTALILCAHAFTHYIGPPDWMVRLSEIANIYALAHNARFEKPKFFALVDQFNALDAVEFMGSLLWTHFGCNPLQRPAEHSATPSGEAFRIDKFPIRLSYFGGWASCFTADELLLPGNERPIINQLGVAEVVATESPQAVIYTTVKDESEISLDRFITINTDEEMLPLKFSVSSGKDALTFRFYLPERLNEGEQYQIVLHDDDDYRNVAWHIIDAHEATTVFTDSSCKENDCRVIYFTDGHSRLLQESALINCFTDISTFSGHIMLRHVAWPKLKGTTQIIASDLNRSVFMMLIVSKGLNSIRQEEPQKLVVVPLHIREDRADRRSTAPRGPQFPDCHFQRCQQ